jgi:hypothetical protein
VPSAFFRQAAEWNEKKSGGEELAKFKASSAIFAAEFAFIRSPVGLKSENRPRRGQTCAMALSRQICCQKSAQIGSGHRPKWDVELSAKTSAKE